MNRVVTALTVLAVLVTAAFCAFSIYTEITDVRPVSGVPLPPGPEPDSEPSPTPAAEPDPVPAPAPTVPPGALEALALDAPLTGEDQGMRPFPYPYAAMFALVSDSDSATPEAFERIHRFINTTEETEYGPGLGLDIADSFWLYMASNLTGTENNMTWFDGTDYSKRLYADMIQDYISRGWIDSIHSYGDFSRKNTDDITFSRELAEKGAQILASFPTPLTVWIDHGNAGNVQNFGSYHPSTASRYQQGDNPAAPGYYHTDITLPTGIRFIWHSRHNDRFGYDFPLVEKELRDGRKVWGFHRYTSEMDGNEIIWNWYPDTLHQQITARRLDDIVEKGQYGLVAQHLSYYGDDYAYPPEALDALRLLARYCNDDKTILVARTSRLLAYAVSRRYVRYTATEFDGRAYINLMSVDDPVSGARPAVLEEARGLTFYCDDPDLAVLLLDGAPIGQADVVRNPADETGRASVAVRWFD